MTVDEILKQKGRRVTSVPPEATLAGIARIMRDNRIGSVTVVNPKGQTIGLVGERAIVEAMAASDACADTVTAAAMMVSPAPSIAANAQVYAAMRQMTATRNRHLVVLDGSAAVGVISIGDIVNARMRDIELENNVLRDIARVKLTD
jgi:CBS domain-containing protein